MLNPSGRITADEALQQRYEVLGNKLSTQYFVSIRFLEEFHDPSDEPVCIPLTDLYETDDYSIENRKGMFYTFLSLKF